jgi:hypothetical protein
MIVQYFVFMLIGLFGMWFGITNDGSFPIELRWFFFMAGTTLCVVSMAKIVDSFHEDNYY